MTSAAAEWRAKYPSFPYIAPFAVIILFIALTSSVPMPPAWMWPAQVLVLASACTYCWPQELSVRPKYSLVSIGIGLAVFLIWIAPDLFIHGYRDSVLFSNSLLGRPHSSLPLDAQRSAWVLTWRVARATIVVPIAEELFWRAWLMRWLIKPEFETVPLGAYAPIAFWLTAVLFGTEHGPYWDVGLITGVIYNAWMVRSKSVADCILMHAVTNFVLSIYVLKTGNWQYWM